MKWIGRLLIAGGTLGLLFPVIPGLFLALMASGGGGKSPSFGEILIFAPVLWLLAVAFSHLMKALVVAGLVSIIIGIAYYKSESAPEGVAQP